MNPMTPATTSPTVAKISTMTAIQACMCGTWGTIEARTPSLT
jgi:hypothetical protein